MKKNETKQWDIGIIGGGAGGLTAAIAATNKNPQCSVVILERKDRIGKKLMATGNGRCNFTNITAAKENYHGTDRDFVIPAISRFSPQDNMAFFKDLGIEAAIEEDGKVYPYSLQASSFLDMLRLTLESRKVVVKTETEILEIKKERNAWLLRGNQENFLCKTVIFAQGGLASPKISGTKSGYTLAKQLGHETTPLFPSLVQIKTENAFTKGLQGIKIQGIATLKSQNQVIKREKGEILFTDYGLSGPPILQLSNYLLKEQGAVQEIVLDFCPEFSKEELCQLLAERRSILGHLTLENFLTGFLQKKVGQLLIKSLLGVKLSVAVSALTDEDLSTLATGLKKYALAFQEVTGWEHAQVTWGGVATANIDAQTMESKLAKGCYFCGEILDIHGDCGGFNLQWAWSSGRLAGESCVKQVYDDKN